MNEQRRPVVQALDEFTKKRPISFHVPGHKNGQISSLPAEMRQALSYDVTELDGLDDLHEPAGIIQEAEMLLAEVYGSDRSFFLVNGSTVGNLAMLYAACQPGETVIVQRNAHKSVFHALELRGASPVFVSPEWNPRTRTPGAVSLASIQQALEEYPEAAAVVLTYPTYYGVTGEGLQEIITTCHAAGLPVLVDEAHGAHFAAASIFPQSALEAGADVVVQSAHKTLPAMTMSSFLHIRSSLLDPSEVARYLRMLQSSSPSYVLMASLDDARSYVASYTEEDAWELQKKVNEFVSSLALIPGAELIAADDPLKLLLRLKGHSGYAVQEALAEAGIYTELADPEQTLLVLPLLKAGMAYPFAEAAERIRNAVAVLGEGKLEEVNKVPDVGDGISTLAYPMQELASKRSEWRDLHEAAGMVAAASIVPYPPGIPVILGGERVTERHIGAVKRYLESGAKFQGAIRIDGPAIRVVID